MDCSNNCSIVLKLTGRGPRGFSYLITGDTENARWDTINRFFGDALKSHVLAAPHHGSKNATHPASLLNIAPHTVLISAGVDSQYGHPDPGALRVYSRVAKYVFSTNMQGGVSMLTQPGTARDHDDAHSTAQFPRLHNRYGDNEESNKNRRQRGSLTLRVRTPCICGLLLGFNLAIFLSVDRNQAVRGFFHRPVLAPRDHKTRRRRGEYSSRLAQYPPRLRLFSTTSQLLPSKPRCQSEIDSAWEPRIQLVRRS